MINAEPIEDTLPATVDKTEEYIHDLENEISSLKAQIKKLKKKPKAKQPLDINCCEAYKKVVANFHKLLDEIIPF